MLYAVNNFGSIDENETIVFERLLPAPIEHVWEYLTTPRYLATWLAEATLDTTVGSPIELSFNVADADDRERAGSVVRGVVAGVSPPYTFAFTWNADSLVTFDLAPHYDEVLLTMRHSGVAPALQQTTIAGWHTHLDFLSARMRNEKPESFLLAYRRLLRAYVDRAVSLQGRL